MAILTITLPDELSKYAEEQVAAGRGASVGDFIRHVLETDQSCLEVDDALLRQIQEGIDDLDQGHVVSGDEVFDSLTRRIEEMRQAGR